MRREKAKGRRDGPTFFAMSHDVMDSPNYTRLSSHGAKLVFDLGRQYNGRNNGDLCAAWSIMRERGWRSKGTLHKAIQQALYYGLIMLTQQGGRHKPNLYALTWKPINECRGKLEVKETKVAPGYWKEVRPAYGYGSNQQN